MAYETADCEKTQAPIDMNDFKLRQEKRVFDRERADSNLMAGRPMTDEEIVAEFFKYHPPTENTILKFAAINQAAKNFAEIVLANCPRGADRTVVIRLIRDARMTANAAVALNGLSLY
jgi:hypothetical protein